MISHSAHKARLISLVPYYATYCDYAVGDDKHLWAQRQICALSSDLFQFADVIALTVDLKRSSLNPISV